MSNEITRNVQLKDSKGYKVYPVTKFELVEGVLNNLNVTGSGDSKLVIYYGFADGEDTYFTTTLTQSLTEVDVFKIDSSGGIYIFTTGFIDTDGLLNIFGKKLPYKENRSYKVIDTAKYEIKKKIKEETTPDYLATFQLYRNSEAIGPAIDITEGHDLKSVTVKIVVYADKQPGGIFENDPDFIIGDRYLDFVIKTVTKDTEGFVERHIYTNLRVLNCEYKAGQGLILDTSTNTFSVLKGSGLKFDDGGKISFDKESTDNVFKPATDFTVGTAGTVPKPSIGDHRSVLTGACKWVPGVGYDEL